MSNLKNELLKIMIISAKSSSEEDVLRRLEETLLTYRATHTKENYFAFIDSVGQALIKYITADMSISDTIKEFNQYDFFRSSLKNKDLN